MLVVLILNKMYVQAEVKQYCDDAIVFLQSRGATVIEIQIPHMHAMVLSHGLKISSEFASRWDVQYHADPSLLEPQTRVVIGLGATVTAQELLAGEKIKAWMVEYVSQLYREHNLTVIATPTIGVEVPILDERAKEIGESNTRLSLQVMKYVFLANFLGLPAYSVPVGFRKPVVFAENEPSTSRYRDGAC